MDWITEHIAIGNFADSEDPDPAIDRVLCLKPDCCRGRADVESLHIPLIDGAGNNPALYRRAVRYIGNAVRDGKHILVHCHAGKSRSVCIVARYFMESEGIGRDEALARIAAKLDIYLSDGIEEIFATM